MFKVLIVDDEPIIRKGLVNIIKWDKMDCMVCGQAGEGGEGIRKIKELMPDIIVADICMPEVDGLTMIKETKSLIPYSKIIILTGYRDFEYIQEAIKLGAFDYILKPSRIEEITDIVKRAVAELKCELKKQDEINKLKNYSERAIPILKEKLLHDIAFNVNKNEQELISDLNFYNIKINNFVMLIIEIDNADKEEISQYELNPYHFGIINTFEEMLSDEFTIDKFSLNDKRIAFIIQPIKEDRNFVEKLYEKIDNLKKMVSKCFNFTITVSISTVGKDVTELQEKMNECLEEYQKNMNTILQKAIDYLNMNFSKQITLNDVAEHTYVSTYYLSRMFKKKLNKNFVDYLNELRIEKAKEYLKDPKYKTYEIAEMVGIQDAHYFSKLFKKHTGMTATEYKSSITSV